MPLSEVPVPAALLMCLFMATIASTLHVIYARRSSPSVREFIDGIKPLLRVPLA
jgi:hypothetical protein